MTLDKWQQERLDAALAYAARGWRVLPVGIDKKPLNPNGSTGATTDAIQITRWWTDKPNANIGVATGQESFFVVDIDIKDAVNGQQSLMEHFGERWHFDTDKNLYALTPSGGIHFLFQYPKGIEVKNSQGILEGIDIRGDGGYIVVAPSARKIDDKWLKYRWNDLNLPIAEAPEWVIELLGLQKEKRADGVDVAKVVSGLSAGERDQELFRFACLLAHRNVPYDMAQAFLSVAAERCNPPFSQAVAMEKVERAYKYPQSAKQKTSPARQLLDLVRGGRK